MENKYKAHQSFVKWMILLGLTFGADLFCYYLLSISDSELDMLIWFMIIGISIGLIAMLGLCIWLIFAGSIFQVDFDKEKITIKNPVLFRKRTTDINFGEISDIRVNKLEMFRLVYVNTNKPHEKSGMTSENGMLVSANLFFLSNKSLKRLDKVLERLKNRYVNL